MKPIATIAFLLTLALPAIVNAECSSDYDNCIKHNLDTANGCYQTYVGCRAQQKDGIGVVGGVIGGRGQQKDGLGVIGPVITDIPRL